MSSLLDLLSKFENLEEILLYGNIIKALPNDMSAINSIKFVDLSNNAITQIEHSLDGLATLTKLTHLSIDVESEDAKDSIINSCAKLEFLNGEEIERPMQVNELEETIPTSKKEET